MGRTWLRARKKQTQNTLQPLYIVQKRCVDVFESILCAYKSRYLAIDGSKLGNNNLYGHLLL